MKRFKCLFTVFALFPAAMLAACSTNPATGEKQFAALMSPQQEVSVGASEHEKIVQQYGLVKDVQLTNYVNEVGNRVSKDTERPDVNYTFYVLDSPIVNAFALPGGYIYVSRGLLALANSEAELGAVLAHETGHITGRHSAERYSRGVVTSLGAGVLSAVIGSQGASQALGLGANLYLSSYSRGQESEADSLGLRYMTRGGYDASAMPSFLYSLHQQSEIENKLAGRSGSGASYFSTHPATQDRVNDTRAQASGYQGSGVINRDRHLQMVNGMTYGDSEAQGFARDQKFYHPQLGFTFEVPDGFNIINQPSQVVATSQAGAIVLFDMAANPKGQDPSSYIQSWAKGKQMQGLETMNVNGNPAATANFSGTVNGQAMNIRLVAIKWGSSFARFTIGIPQNASAAMVDGLKKTTYSFRSMTAAEKQNIKPLRLKTFTASASDSVSGMARRLPFSQLQEERFRVLNGLQPGEGLQAGKLYKTVVE